MKQLLPFLLLALFTSMGCKKDHMPPPTVTVSGDVKLTSQTEVDAFVKQYTGKKLQINGNLAIGLAVNSSGNLRSNITSVAGLSSMVTAVSGTISFYDTQFSEAPFLNTLTSAGGLFASNCDFTSLKLKGLQSFSGDIFLQFLDKLTELDINGLSSVNKLEISICPLLTDLSCLNQVRTAASVSLRFLYAVTTIKMDNLTNVTASGIDITGDNKLNNVSFSSLNNVTGHLYFVSCQQLSSLNFKALKSVSDRVTIYLTNVTDLTSFTALQTAGAINITGNPLLGSLHGLEQVTKVTMPGINGSVVYSAGGPSIGLSGLQAALGGVTIESNATLSSLDGLQHIAAIPVAYIRNNKALNDFCPFKTLIKAVRLLPDYSYTYVDIPSDMQYNRTTTALTITNNGNYATTSDALAAVALCK